jgi:hypothetical protein
MKTADLTGPELDKRVATAENLFWQANSTFVFLPGEVNRHGNPRIYAPSTNWADGGPIIEREGIGVVRDDPQGDLWLADIGGWMSHDYVIGRVVQRGPTPLIAAMRAFVALKFGDEV